jgi:tetratricopeptide (TPR) repeat protein
MSRWLVAVLAVTVASAASAADLKATLSKESPEDRAILAYLERAEAKTATATDLTELGVLLAETHRLADAEHWLRAAVKLDKHSFTSLYRLGLVQQRRGDCSDAARSFARALDVKPDDPYARFMLALAEERCDSPTRAIRDYARAYEVMPALAEPETNPLVIDSDLQTQAALEAYEVRSSTSTFELTAVDRDAVKTMMEAATPVPTEATPAAGAQPGAAATSAPAAPVAPTPTPEPAKATATKIPPPGAPGGSNPRKPQTGS